MIRKELVKVFAYSVKKEHHSQLYFISIIENRDMDDCLQFFLSTRSAGRDLQL